MDFRLTEEQQLMMQNLKELLKREASDAYLTECEEKHEWPAKAWKALADNGYLGIGMPEKYGGTPASALDQILMTETLSRYAGALSSYYSLSFMVCHDLDSFASEEQKDKVIPEFIKGEATLGLAITEPQAGSDDSAMATSHRIEGDKVIINGQKTWITNADRAKYLVLLTRDPDVANPYQGVSMWLLPTNTPGLTVVPIPKMSSHTQESCELFLDNVVLPKSAMLGQLNNGWKQLMVNFGFERAIAGAASLGAAEGALDEAVPYSNKRVQFGNPIGTYQLVQKRVAEMALKIELLRGLVYRVAAMVDNHEPIRVEAAMVKLYGSVAAQEVIDDAIQIMGGVGVMSSNRLTRMFQDARIGRIGGGTDEMMIRAIAPMIQKAYK